MNKRIAAFCLILISVTLPGIVFGQSGKIAGTVLDEETGQPLPGAQIMVTARWIGDNEVRLKEMMGTTADEDGDFYIINVPPDDYTVTVQMMGYSTMRFPQVHVSVNRTISLTAELESTVLTGEEVVITARAVGIKKDQTSSIRNISSKDIEELPIESLDQVVGLQPGVVGGHFRGGRMEEVSYLIDGLQVDEAFSQSGRTVSVNPEVAEDVEIVTGAFNAEYGRAMSGIVNIVTRDGGNRLNGMISYEMGGYLTSHDDIFVGLPGFDFTKKNDFNMSLSGPLVRDNLFFVLNGRYQYNEGPYYGIERFKVNDYSNFQGDPSKVYSEHNGSGDYVNMEWGKSYNIFSKLSYKPSSSLKTAVTYTVNDNEGQGYDHYYKYNPDGRATGYGRTDMVALQFNHMLGDNIFYDLKGSLMDNYTGDYVYEDPTDSRYVHDQFSIGGAGSGFSTGGQQKHHLERTLRDFNLTFDFNWQINKRHKVKTGAGYIAHEVHNSSREIRNEYTGTGLELVSSYDSTAGKIHYPYYEPVVMSDSTVYSDIYTQKPYEFSVYMQDKMEFGEMVVNLGVRYDYFNSNTTYPSQLRNPANQLYFPLKDENGNIVYDGDGNPILDPERMSSYPSAEAKHQVSPRLGLSYQLGSSALLRFSYGHFFQMPPLYALYQNHSKIIAPNDYATTNGNPNVNAQRTIQYEVGLWQELMPGMELDIAVFYKDIYDLLSTKVITTYNQIKYGLYTNKDYGNVRGLEAKYNIRYGAINAMLSYTFQYTRGNADNPQFNFSRAGANIDPVLRMIPMSWDQRHTLNVSAGYSLSKFGANFVATYESGFPYTWAPIPEDPLSRVNLYPNNDYKPAQINVDLNAYYDLFQYKSVKGTVTLLVYNLLDRLNEASVYSSTGRAYTTIARESEIAAHRSDFTDYWDSIHNPAMYTAPRMFKIGFEITY